MDDRYLMRLDVYPNLSQRYEFVVEVHHMVRPRHLLEPVLFEGAYEFRFKTSNGIDDRQGP